MSLLSPGGALQGRGPQGKNPEEVGGPPGTFPAARGPTLCPHLSVHLPTVCCHSAGAGPAVRNVSTASKPRELPQSCLCLGNALCDGGGWVLRDHTQGVARTTWDEPWECLSWTCLCRIHCPWLWTLLRDSPPSLKTF
jgi:hypothetical protein